MLNYLVKEAQDLAATILIYVENHSALQQNKEYARLRLQKDDAIPTLFVELDLPDDLSSCLNEKTIILVLFDLQDLKEQCCEVLELICQFHNEVGFRLIVEEYILNCFVKA